MGQTDDIFIAVAQSPEEREACLEIRRKVFIEEQDVDEQRERDEHDKDAIHYLALRNGKPIATARVRHMDDETVKVERVAVLPEARGMNIGRLLMLFIEASSEIDNKPKIKLDAQTYSVPFYERLGYKAHGDEFMDAGIPHRHMFKIHGNSQVEQPQ